MLLDMLLDLSTHEINDAIGARLHSRRTDEGSASVVSLHGKGMASPQCMHVIIGWAAVATLGSTLQIPDDTSHIWTS